jgi:serine/threonine protein kinase
MRQCQKCNRLLSNQVTKCLYCRNENFKELVFTSSSVSASYMIYSHEIVVDGVAYTIVKPLGKGGFGTVIKVIDTTENKYYAMKVPLIFDEIFSNNKANKEDDIEISQKYLENEIDTILKYMDDTFLFIYKKGIAQTYSHGKKVEFPVFLMELADGTVNDLIKFESEGKNQIAYEEKVKMIREMVNTISCLHSINVVHRDLSPDNVFVVDRGGKISYVLGDFGASKRLYDTSVSGKSSKIVGHSAYLDPARFEEKYRYDLRVDLYSLGIIVMEILMGKFWIKVFGEENIYHLVALDFEKEFLLTEGKKVINDNIIEVLRKAVKRNLEERYESVDEFRNALFSVLDISSQAMTVAYRTTPQPRPEELKSKSLAFDFFFNVNLPFSSSNQTFAQDIIEFDRDRKIELRDYRGAKIVFKDYMPKKAILRNTSLYTVVPSENAILLNFKNSEFKKILKSIKEVEQDIEGELSFKGTIESEGVEA